MAVVTTRFNSIALGGFVTFTAVIPFEDYGDNFLKPNLHPYEAKEPLRTLYLLHGVTGDEQDWIYGTRIERYAKEHHIAVIMPNGNNNFYVDNSPTERWGEFIGKELVEVTRGLFPLSEKREDTFIGGLSMGGYGAIRNGFKYSKVFSKIIALSSALVTYNVPNAPEHSEIAWETKSHYERMFGNLEEFVGSDMDPEQVFMDREEEVDLFMAIGTEDFLLDYDRRYKTFLENHNANLTYYEEPGAHEWDFWDRNIKKGIGWLEK